MNPIRLEYWQFLRDNPGSTITFSEWRSIREAKIRREESKYSVHCPECSGCGDEFCCSPLRCKMSENGGDYCQIYLTDLKYGYSVKNDLLKMIGKDPKYKELVDEIIDRNYDRFYRGEDKMDKLEEAYQEYLRHPSDYEYKGSREWFTNELLYNDDFCEKWGSKCTVEMTYSERWNILLERNGPLGLNHDRIEQQVERETPKRKIVA
jgi:hypothetical protein